MKFWRSKKNTNSPINEEYVQKNAADIKPEDIEKVVSQSSKIESKILGSKQLMGVLADAKLLLELIRDYWKKDYTEIPWYAITAITFSLLYILNPLDISPDFIPFVGYIDDITVFTFALNLVKKDVNTYKNWKKIQG